MPVVEEVAVDLVVYHIVETEYSYALSMQTRVDEAAATAAGKAFLDVVGDRIPELVGGILIVQGQELDDQGQGFITTQSRWPEDLDVDTELVNEGVEALMATLVKLLLPDAQIAGFTQTNTGYLN